MLVKHHLGWWRTLFRVLLCFYSCSYYSSHAVFCFAAVEFDPAVPFLVDLSSTKQLNMYKFRRSHESLTKIQMFLFLDIFRQFYSVWWHELTLNWIIILTQTCPKLFPEWSLSLPLPHRHRILHRDVTQYARYTLHWVTSTHFTSAEWNNICKREQQPTPRSESAKNHES